MNKEIKPIEPPTGIPKGVKIAIAILIVVIVCLVLFTSCSTVQKLKDVEKTTTNVNAETKSKIEEHKKTDSTNVKKDNTVTTTETEGAYTKETIIEFDTARLHANNIWSLDSTWLPGSGTTAEDFFYPGVKKITIKETGTNKKKETVAKNTYDSTNVKTDYYIIKTTTTVVTTITKTFKKHKTVERTSYWGWLWLVPLLILLIVIYRYRKQILFTLKNVTRMKKLIFLALVLALPFAAICQETVTISPTWGQSFKWANMAGQGWYIFFGFVLLAAAVAFFLAVKNGKIKANGTGLGFGLFIILALALMSFLAKPGLIRWNNDKEVNKVYLEKVGEPYIWDSLQNNCLIVDGPYRCK